VPFGCELISTAIWRGVPLKDVIDLAGGLKPAVMGITLVAADEFTSAIPLEVALDPTTLLAYEMNGEPLPYEHGYPARVLSVGRYGYKSPKWLTAIRPTSGMPLDWYGRRNWNKEGVVKTMARIDVPAPYATVPAGARRVAGIAYAGDRGVAGVEVSPDGGRTWQAARLLEPAPGKDAWVRWEAGVDLPPGATARLVARAMDGTGQPQTKEFSLPAPDGASGWNSIQVTVG
jgi:DMSO/TMAO reductase YedYZ molybdopterin-dependent catalytic subunit